MIERVGAHFMFALGAGTHVRVKDWPNNRLAQ